MSPLVARTLYTPGSLLGPKEIAPPGRPLDYECARLPRRLLPRLPVPCPALHGALLRCCTAMTPTPGLGGSNQMPGTARHLCPRGQHGGRVQETLSRKTGGGPCRQRRYTGLWWTLPSLRFCHCAATSSALTLLSQQQVEQFNVPYSNVGPLPKHSFLQEQHSYPQERLGDCTVVRSACVLSYLVAHASQVRFASLLLSPVQHVGLGRGRLRTGSMFWGWCLFFWGRL